MNTFDRDVTHIFFGEKNIFLDDFVQKTR